MPHITVFHAIFTRIFFLQNQHLEGRWNEHGMYATCGMGTTFLSSASPTFCHAWYRMHGANPDAFQHVNSALVSTI